MGVLEGLEPKRVLEIFEQLCAIPHGSGNTKAISDYCAEFARQRGLACCQDAANNVVCVKAASPGMEQADTVILQGHLDMVCEKTPESGVDFAKDAITLAVSGGWVHAVDTSLGADDGIAVAMVLAILEDPGACHPRLEAVFTTDEETGMDGARALDLSGLRGRRLINLDSEEEGVFTVSCAGGARIDCMVSLAWQPAPPAGLELVIEGLRGGHSGVMIDKGLGNANVLMGRLLYGLCQTLPVQLSSLSGGEQDNAIARQCRAVVWMEQGHLEKARAIAAAMAEQFARELAASDPAVAVRCRPVAGEAAEIAVRPEDTKKLAGLLLALPNGVQSMSQQLAGLVQTSANLGVLRLTDRGLQARFSVRSSLASEKEYLISRIQAIAAQFGGRTERTGDYPAWEYQPQSALLEAAVRTYRSLFGKEPKIEAIHAGLECGVFAGGIQGLQCISFGPNLRGVHTTQEAMELSSVERTYRFLRQLLAQLG